MTDNPGDQNPFRAMAIVGVLGADLAIPTVAGYFAGTWFDGRVGTSPLFLVLGILLGIASGIFMVIKHVAYFMPEKPKK